MPWTEALAVFIGTLPVFGALVWNLIEVRSIRVEITAIRERLATLEERDRLSHPVISR